MDYGWFLFRVRRLGVVQTLITIMRSRGKLRSLQRSDKRGVLTIPGTDLTLVYRHDSMDWIVFHQIFENQEYSVPPEVLDIVQNPSVIFDLGANVGYATAYFATQFPKARVIAVEPCTENFRVLAENLRNFENVESIRGAVWNVDGYISGNDEFRDGESWSFSVSDAEGDIPAFSVDNLLSRFNVSGSVWMKIDIEGAETKLFSDNTAWLECVDLLWIELHPDSRFGDPSPLVQRAAHTYGFTAVSASETTILYKER